MAGWAIIRRKTYRLEYELRISYAKYLSLVNGVRIEDVSTFLRRGPSQMRTVAPTAEAPSPDQVAAPDVAGPSREQTSRD